MPTKGLNLLILGALSVLLCPVHAQEEDELLLGVFPRRNSMQTVSTFTPLAEYLSKALERPVRLATTPDYGSFWTALEQEQYDIVHFNQYHYIRSHKQLDYQVVAMNEEFGSGSVRAVIGVSHDSGINTVEDLRGRKIVFGGGPHSMLSYIVPTYLLSRAGLARGEYDESFSRHPCNSVLAVCVGQAEVAGTNDGAISLHVANGHCVPGSVRNLLSSEPMAQLPWATKGSLPASLHQRIKQALLRAKETSEGRAALSSAELTGLLPAYDSDYDPYRKIVRAVLHEEY